MAISSILSSGTSESYNALAEKLKKARRSVVLAVNLDGDRHTPELIEQQPDGELRAHFFSKGKRLYETSENLILPAKLSDSDWILKGAGNFNKDKKMSLLFQHKRTGELLINELTGTTLGESQVLDIDARNKDIVGVYSIPGKKNAKTIIISEEKNGQLKKFVIEGKEITDSEDYPAHSNVGLGWQIVGAGNFDGEREEWRDNDLILMHGDGTEKISLYNFTHLRDEHILLPMGPSDKEDWIVGVADMNGDGKSDIIRQQEDGAVKVYFMDGVMERDNGYGYPLFTNQKMKDEWNGRNDP